VRSFNIKNYISENQFLAKRTYARAYKIVAVSRMVKEKIEHEYGFSNVMEINNPIEPMDLERGSEAVLSQDYILYFGRLDEKVKHLTLLIDAYSESKLSDKGVSLVIMGSGPDEEFLKAYANTKKTCSLIKFIEFNPFPASTIKRALFTVLTSRWEGFPRMILESLSLGVPVLSVKCKSGPEELIVHEENGLLVMNNNIQALALGMDRLISDEALYKHCKRNAQRSIKPYSLEQISQKWQMILK
jgi:glycosyltransferase involved in cell wall biosynthesis